MNSASAWSPAAIAFLYRKQTGHTMDTSGSLGIGCTVRPGVTARVSKSTRLTVSFNGKPILFPTVIDGIRQLTGQPVSVQLRSPLPLGYGFGLSAACLLATVYAVRKLLGLSVSRKELISICHASELKHHTGLGTVGTIMAGGFLVKTRAGIPPSFYSIAIRQTTLRAVIIRPIFTPSIISNPTRQREINRIADNLLSSLSHHPIRSMDDALDVSYDFVTRAGLLTDPDTRQMIETIRKTGNHASMTILGNVVLTTAPLPKPISYPCITLTLVSETCRSLS